MWWRCSHCALKEVTRKGNVYNVSTDVSVDLGEINEKRAVSLSLASYITVVPSPQMNPVHCFYLFPLLEELYQNVSFFLWMILPGSQFPLPWMIKFSTFLTPSQCSPHQGLMTAQQGRAVLSCCKKSHQLEISSDFLLHSIYCIQLHQWPLVASSLLSSLEV